MGGAHANGCQPFLPKSTLLSNCRYHVHLAARVSFLVRVTMMFANLFVQNSDLASADFVYVALEFDLKLFSPKVTEVTSSYFC